VGSSPNLEDMHRKETSPIGQNNWCRNECDFLNLEVMFFMKGRVMALDPRGKLWTTFLVALKEKNQYVTNAFITTCDRLQLNFCPLQLV
jgi:hypothetical protein